MRNLNSQWDALEQILLRQNSPVLQTEMEFNKEKGLMICKIRQYELQKWGFQWKTRKWNFVIPEF